MKRRISSEFHIDGPRINMMGLTAQWGFRHKHNHNEPRKIMFLSNKNCMPIHNLFRIWIWHKNTKNLTSRRRKQMKTISGVGAYDCLKFKLDGNSLVVFKCENDTRRKMSYAISTAWDIIFLHSCCVGWRVVCKHVYLITFKHILYFKKTRPLYR